MKMGLMFNKICLTLVAACVLSSTAWSGEVAKTIKCPEITVSAAITSGKGWVANPILEQEKRIYTTGLTVSSDESGIVLVCQPDTTEFPGFRKKLLFSAGYTHCELNGRLNSLEGRTFTCFQKQ